MAEASRAMVADTKRNDSGPDYLGYYKRVVLDLFSQNDGILLPFSGLDLESSAGTCSKGVERSTGSHLLFSGGIAEGLSDFKRERLKAFLIQSVVGLNQETDEILERILAMFQIDTDLSEKELLSRYSSESDEDMNEPICSKKQKSSVYNNLCKDAETQRPQSFRQAYDDFQALVKNGLQPEEAVDRCFDDIFVKLGQMEQNLEEYLDIVVSKSRPMTGAEKQQLGQQIQKLPVKALDRVVEIIHQRNSSERPIPDKLHVNLEKEDDVTLWRLYYYVETISKANK